MALIAPEAQGRSRPRAEGNKCQYIPSARVIYYITRALGMYGFIMDNHPDSKGTA